MRYLLLVSFFFSINITSHSQLPFGLVAAQSSATCKSCVDIIDVKPKEVLFGISIGFNGDVFFTMTSAEWFHKIFVDNSFGVTADIVSKDRYKCGVMAPTLNLPKGLILKPIYKNDIVNSLEDVSKNSIVVKIGTLPENMIGKELEGNLVIVKEKNICYYSNFVNIDRSDWNILSMGFFTDSLMNYDFNDSTKSIINSKQIAVQISFAKNSTTFNKTSITKQLDSLLLNRYVIKNISIHTFSSVEGGASYNETLSTKRSNSILDFLRTQYHYTKPIKVVNNENWVEFTNSLDEHEIFLFDGLNKQDIKIKLLDKKLKDSLEYLLKNHRKSFVSFTVSDKQDRPLYSKDSLLDKLQTSINDKNIKEALILQKNIAHLISDNELPVSYLNQLEVPKEKEFSSLINDNIMYRLMLKSSTEYETLQNLKEVYALDSTNGKLNYNITALEFYIWSNDDTDSSLSKSILSKLQNLTNLGIDSSLVKRLWVNYYILQSRDYFNAGKYELKDSLVLLISDIYSTLTMSDVDILRLSKFYTYYSFSHLALYTIAPRAKSLDISEDLLFYYLNLLFFFPSEYESSDFDKAMLNAANINRKRFCQLFSSNNWFGASMQLLDYSGIKTRYCESCLK